MRRRDLVQNVNRMFTLFLSTSRVRNSLNHLTVSCMGRRCLSALPFVSNPNISDALLVVRACNSNRMFQQVVSKFQVFLTIFVFASRLSVVHVGTVGGHLFQLNYYLLYTD